MKRILFIFVAMMLSLVVSAQKESLEIGNVAPEISLPTPKGDTVKLSSLRGKMVLIEFWASWCKPCRKENPNVVKAYNAYKDKYFQAGDGFAVYGVSLDKSAENWANAIETDNLTWTNVSDLQYWNSIAGRMYQVNSIPCNFLIDGNGVIVGKNLRGEALEQALEKYIFHPTESFEETLVSHKTQLDNPKEVQAVDKQDNKKNKIISDVDINIPCVETVADNTYILIIANEKYMFNDPVNFAVHDGEIFKEYCIKTLGVPEKQIFYYENASYGMINDGIDMLKYILNNIEGSRGIVYYCGHGIPDEKTGEAFIVPVDGKGTNTITCYSLNTLYKTLAETKAANVTYFMDACFTGANKEGSMLVAARGVAREPAKATVGGNTIVFSASSGDETAMTYLEKGHGLFTYFLLKKLQETGGNVSYSELSNYINSNVKKEAILINQKKQTPVVATSPNVQEKWKDMKLK